MCFRPLNPDSNTAHHTVMRLLFAVLICQSLAVTSAQAYLATNDLKVVATGPQAFHVPYRGQSGAPAFWCAAGDYVVRKLGLSHATRIYRTSSGPRQGGNGIDFSLSSQGAKSSGLLVISRDKGISAGHARALCEARRRRK